MSDKFFEVLAYTIFSIIVFTPVAAVGVAVGLFF